MVLDLRGKDEYSECPLCLKKLSPQPRRFRYFFTHILFWRTTFYTTGIYKANFYTLYLLLGKSH
jgi:hypothetical protein